MGSCDDLSEGLDRLVALMKGKHVLALSGAGLSTESGIPDYRGPRSLQRRTRPIYYRDFVENAAARARYWVRSTVGWPRVAAALPNAGHRALAALERAGALSGVITQNVDRLHHAAGSGNVLELHGALADVVCLACGAVEARSGLQARILSSNPRWAVGVYRSASAEPDGDAHVEPPADGSFLVPACLRCGGMLKPDVTFFGENVPRERVKRGFAMLDRATVLLVVGSSLAVFSGYRFVMRAAGGRKPIAIVNSGPTRGDSVASVRIDAMLGDFLPRLADALVTSA